MESVSNNSVKNTVISARSNADNAKDAAEEKAEIENIEEYGESLIKWTPNGICFKQFSEKDSNLRKIVFSRVIE